MTTTPQNETATGPDAHLMRAIDVLRATVTADPELADALDRVRDALLDDLREGDRFLSVLVRTRADRPETLRDVLLCLAAQTDDDFEVILLVHNAADQVEVIQELVSTYPEGFATRVRVVEVAGGGRTRPLNVGLEQVRGRYVVVLDDDDLVFAHWVETFDRTARESPGKIVRAGTTLQNASPETWSQGETGFRSTSAVRSEYADTFDPFHHFGVNHTPFMSFAFPAFVFRRLGLTFDESLPVLEDWDMLLRASSLCGVRDSPELTSVYRRWEQGNSSYTEHDDDEWGAATATIIAKLDAEPFLVPPGSASRIRGLIADENARYQLNEVFRSRSWRWAWPLRSALRVGAYGRRVLTRMRRRG